MSCFQRFTPKRKTPCNAPPTAPSPLQTTDPWQTHGAFPPIWGTTGNTKRGLIQSKKPVTRGRGRVPAPGGLRLHRPRKKRWPALPWEVIRATTDGRADRRKLRGAAPGGGAAGGARGVAAPPVRPPGGGGTAGVPRDPRARPLPPRQTG